jgi:hypothetical protein
VFGRARQVDEGSPSAVAQGSALDALVSAAKLAKKI